MATFTTPAENRQRPAQWTLAERLTPAEADGLRETWFSHAFNVGLAIVGLILLSPVMAVTALLVRLTSRGPILYRGRRVGLHGKDFIMLKFRTMEVGAEQKIGARLAASDDPFTPIGRFLKASRVDEFPQLLNVVRRDMNLIGPRPIRPIFLQKYLNEMPQYWRRFVVRPGMSCISHVSGGFYSPVRQRLRHDLIYLRNRSVLLDAGILFWTVVKVLGRWFQPSSFLLFFFLLGSYLPPSLMAHFYVKLSGKSFNVFYLTAVIFCAILLGRQVFVPRFVIYRTPFTWFVPAFAALGILNVAFSHTRFSSLRGNGFLWATGIIPALAIVHSETSGRLAKKALQVIAVCSGCAALVGLAMWGIFSLRLFWASAGAPSSPGAWLEFPRAGGLFEAPVVFGTFVVSGLPLLFMLAHQASSRRSRTAYLALAVVGALAVQVSQTRYAIAALVIAGPLCLWKWSRRAALWLLVALCAAWMALAISFPGRFRATPVEVEAEARVRKGIQSLSALRLWEFVWGAGAKATEDKSGERAPLASVRSVAVKYFVEFGALGVLLLTFLFVDVLRLCFRRGQREGSTAKQEMWGIGSSIVALWIATNGFGSVYQIATQLLFWGLLALACGIVVRRCPVPGERTTWRIRRHGDDFRTGPKESPAGGVV